MLDHVRAGVFETVWLIPFASSWSMLRHSDSSGQLPLCTRIYPLGVPELTPSALLKVRKVNRELEAIVWCANQP